MQADQTVIRVVEGLGYRRNNLKSELLPEVNGGDVRRDDGIELNGSIPLRASPVDHVLTKRAPHTMSLQIGIDHKTGGRDMGTSTGAIGPHLRGAQDDAALNGDDGTTRWPLHPQRTRLF